ncbi:heavy-metal-associated domain-containing protein [Tahibacter soli]|uniref:Heavy-metal-associated domain-containing protein n=1 Tax=Tahibacter soli TaxID=2983605 RepID=A0A9X3YML3_9GAMM|nr:heavy-metal-associated domain-containing protein [Tahibacter soli]MDC8014447.1 heavy-metal-associated domain-containing protein [Tahibacter soli]
MIFRVEGMTCGGCARRVTRAVQALDANAAVAVDLARGTVEVGSTADATAVAAAIAAAGYPATAV